MSRSRIVSNALRCAAVAAATALGGANAHEGSADDAERTRLPHERVTIDATYSARIGQCAQRFVVTSCVEDAKRDRRQGLDALRLRQIALDEARRKERAAARRAELSAHAAEEARRDTDRAIRPEKAASPAAASPASADRAVAPRRPTPKNPSTSRSRTPRAGASASGAAAVGGVDRAARESRSRASFEARQKEAAEHRDDVLQKAARRAQQHRPAAPLPIPKDTKTAP